MVIFDNPVVAGPCSTAPVRPLKTDPWHGHTNFRAESWNCTMHPAWGHTASKAANLPAEGCTTSPGSPELGSWKDAAPPTGTTLAAPMRVPGGTAACVVLGAEVVGDVVGGVVAPVPADVALPEPTPNVGAPGRLVVVPTSRPRPAARPAPRT